jgi:hypothetical protein
MHFHHINLLSVLVAAVSTMVVGFVWTVESKKNTRRPEERFLRPLHSIIGNSFVQPCVTCFGIMFQNQTARIP